MKSDYCAYPPQLADDVEITEQRDGARTVFILGAASVGRYLLLRETEQRVMSLLDGGRTGTDVCREFSQQTGASLSLPTLVKFLTKLDNYGILAGERAQGVSGGSGGVSKDARRGGGRGSECLDGRRISRPRRRARERARARLHR